MVKQTLNLVICHVTSCYVSMLTLIFNTIFIFILDRNSSAVVEISRNLRLQLQDGGCNEQSTWISHTTTLIHFADLKGNSINNQ